MQIAAHRIVQEAPDLIAGGRVVSLEAFIGGMRDVSGSVIGGPASGVGRLRSWRSCQCCGGSRS